MSQEQLYAGTAEIDITPPVGHRMAGHFYEVLSGGVHDPIKAKALVMQQGDEKAALAFCDVVSLPQDVSRRARRSFSTISDTPVDNITVFATHSHTGPLFGTIQRDFFHEQTVAMFGSDHYEKIDFSDILINNIYRALNLADDSLAPADLTSTTVSQEGLAFNRRFHMRDGSVRFNPGQLNPDIIGPAGPTDPEISNLLITHRATQRAIGGLTVFACHADTLGGRVYSADYPYFIQEALRNRFNEGSFISAFAEGACGDINHIDVSSNGPRKGLEVTERIGTAIGEAILSAREPHVITEPSLKTASATFEVPLQEVTSSQIEAARASLAHLGEPDADDHFTEVVRAIKILDLAQKGSSWPVEIQAFRLDRDTAFIGLPGEVFSELGLAIRKASPFKRTTVATLANEGFSYIPTQKAFQEGSYEVEHSLVKPGVGEQLAEQAVGLLDELAE